jgi:hypothetical protein
MLLLLTLHLSADMLTSLLYYDASASRKREEQRQERNVVPGEVTVLPEKRFREAMVVFDLE